MSCRISVVPAIVALVLLACGKSTTNSDSAATSGGGSSSADDGGGARGSSAQSAGGTSENTATGGENSSDADDSSSHGGMTQSVATGGSTGDTTDSTAHSATTAGGEASTTGSAGDTGMTAEQLGCIVIRGSQCLTDPELSFACPRDAPVPDTCSECYEPGVSEQGHPINQCLATLPDGGPCHNCCCEPSESGCEERPDDTTGCVGHPDMPRLFVCVKPYEEPSGCSRARYSDLVDEYCCP